MTAPRIQRRLAAILAADVVGYSRLMPVDEEATLDRLKVLWRDILLFAGDHARAEDRVLRALRINPLPAAWYDMAQGKIQYARRRYHDAVTTRRHPETYRSASRRYLAAALAQMGQEADARAEAALSMASSPGFSIRHWVGATEHNDAATLVHFVEGYRKAGLPG